MWQWLRARWRVFALRLVVSCRARRWLDAVVDASEREALEGVPEGVPEVQGLSRAFFLGVLGYDALFYFYGIGENALQMLQVGGREVKVYQLRPVLFVGDESVFQHFGVARTQVGRIQCFEEIRVDDYVFRVAENANLIFQAAEIDARLSTYRGVHHG